MSTWYLWIKAMQEPFDHGLDAARRQQYAFNVMAMRFPSNSPPVGDFEDEVVGLLAAAGVAPSFVSSKAELPLDDGPFLTLVATGGAPPESVQNQTAKYRNPTAQIVAHAKDSTAAKAMAVAAYGALATVRNRAV